MPSALARRFALLACASALALLVVPAGSASAASCTTALGPHASPFQTGCSAASLFASPAPADPGAEVSFDASGSVGPDGVSAVGIASYAWDFGDGTAYATASPVEPHTYAARGFYAATVTLLDGGGQALTTPASFGVYVSAMPVADFTPPAGTLRPSVAYDFDASASTAPGGSIDHYEWDWGDGTTSQTAGPIAQHTFTTEADRDVQLIVVNDVGLASDPAIHTVGVHNVKPDVQLVATPSTVAIGQTLTLSAAGSSDPDGAIVEYRWDLDANGSFETTTGLGTSVSAGGFPNAGIVQLHVKAIDDSGGFTIRTAAITVVEATGGGGGGGTTGGGGSTGGGSTGGSGSGSGGSGAGGSGTGSGASSGGGPFAVGLSGALVQRLRTALRRGVGLKALANRGATGTLTLKLSARDARRLHLARRRARKAVTIGAVRVTLVAGATAKPKIKLTRKAARALRRAHPRSLRLTVRGTLTAGAARTTASRVVLLRG